MSNIEVEIRTFLQDGEYEELLSFFAKKAKFLKEDYQETYYFNCLHDLRIQRNKEYAKIWLKKGKIHDEAREEVEVKFPREDFERIEALFLALGYEVDVKWFRKRFEFLWGDIKVSIDDTRGYGKILELEILTSDDQKEKALGELKKTLKALKLKTTPREEFDKKFEDYRKNWRKI